MKVFIDMRPAEIDTVRFGIWCTVRGLFEEFSGSQAWDTAEEFQTDMVDDGLEPLKVLRFTRLIPAWARVDRGVCVHDPGVLACNRCHRYLKVGSS